ncbi:hypothetical protein [Streptoalloteichus hindustanus]|uniref:Uncharacterized protein n=1 Tax=Streptoalloteichus hindustanus TaxID=2017 RepID=A0A1M5BBA6_STRHI|nr:hypothetical protein [Streptoalloteichus hindustanus]SHF39794.1 hypothetical protein SAMN05444320_103492 [Streptoalloteichus hindustanus]
MRKRSRFPRMSFPRVATLAACVDLSLSIVYLLAGDLGGSGFGAGSLRFVSGTAAPGSVLARTVVVQHKGWGEFYTEGGVVEAGCGILSFGVVYVDVRLDDFRVVGVSGYYGRVWDADPLLAVLPERSEPRDVMLLTDADLAPGVAVGEEAFFAVRAVGRGVLYEGPWRSSDVAKWVFCSAGFWVGCDDVDRLNAIYLPSGM